MADELRQLCETFLRGELPRADFLSGCLKQSSTSLPFAEIDHDRARRCGFPEVIFAEGKPMDALLSIAETLHQRGEPVFATRCSVEQQAALSERFPGGLVNELARTFRIPVADESPETRVGNVVVLAAGTSDLAVAAESLETLAWMGIQTTPIYDVGVAGPHRLPAHLPLLERADAVVVVAGMEGALPSVVGGYVSCPVIGVPTSVGYGANLQGMAALLSMVNSCAANITVVNIDAGFKGGYVAGLISHRMHTHAR